MSEEIPNLFDLINRTSEVEKLFTIAENDSIPWQWTVLKTIHDKPEFVLWKNQLKNELKLLPQDNIVKETIELLDNGFQSWNGDEQDFIRLKAKLSIIAEHPDKYAVNSSKYFPMGKKRLIGKGTLVKTAFDEYELIKQVGSGGNGRVFSATDKDGKQVAIKFVEKGIGVDKLKRFKNEIYFCEYHKHKNIVEIIDRGYAYLDDKDYVFYVMPLYAQTLRAKIKDGILPDDTIKIITGLLEGLQYAHSLGTIHRDVKPENIMFAENSIEPIICDFGIAHFAEEDLVTAVETKKADRMANFQYAAPEQRVKGGIITPQTDIYAVGLIMNEMFTREIPQANGYKKIADVNEEYEYLDTVFEKMFQQKPEERIYPEKDILLEIKLLAEQRKREKEKQLLEEAIYEMERPEEFVASIIDKDYEDGDLVMIFDRDLPAEWVQILMHDSYSRSYMNGYEPHRLRKNGNAALSMPLRGNEDSYILKRIIDDVASWAETVNRRYSQRVKERTEREFRAKEDAKRKEIERLEKEIALSAMIKSL